MPWTNKQFFIDNHKTISNLLKKYQIEKCILSFNYVTVSMIVSVTNPQYFYQLKDDLIKLAVEQKIAHTIELTADSASGQHFPVPQNAINFFDMLQNQF